MDANLTRHFLGAASLASFSAADASRLLASVPDAPKGQPLTAESSSWDEGEGRWRNYRATWNPETGRYDVDRHEVDVLGRRIDSAGGGR